jgi:hypothetical protein
MRAKPHASNYRVDSGALSGHHAAPWVERFTLAVVLPLANSASLYSNPCSRTTLAQCSWPVIGLRMGSTLVSITPLILTRPVRLARSSSNSIGANIGSCILTNVWRTH